MAIKNESLRENGNPTNLLTMESVVESLQAYDNENLSDLDIKNICDLTIENLLRVYVPKSSVELKQFKIVFLNATDLLHSIVKRANNAEQIYVHCLQTLYKELILKGMNNKNYWDEFFFLNFSNLIFR